MWRVVPALTSTPAGVGTQMGKSFENAEIREVFWSYWGSREVSLAPPLPSCVTSTSLGFPVCKVAFFARPHGCGWGSNGEALK